MTNDTTPRASAKAQFDSVWSVSDGDDPIERLRCFCSKAMNGQDWFDVEPFLDALTPRAACEGAGSIPSEAVEREAFERWYADLRGSEITIDNSVEWLAWKARAALAVPNEGAEFEPGTCARCGKDYSMHDPQMEPTKYCNDCAHVIAESVPVGPSEGSPVSNQFIEKLNELSPSEGIASVAASDGSNQLLGLLAIQAEDIRKVLDELAPETVGNLQTRIRAALAASDESLSRQSSEAAESHLSTRKTQGSQP